MKDQTQEHININNTLCTNNYADNWIEAIDKNEKLYERLLEVKREKLNSFKKCWLKKIQLRYKTADSSFTHCQLLFYDFIGHCWLFHLSATSMTNSQNPFYDAN
jgi:hypothetical protein